MTDLAAKVEAAEGPTFELMCDAFDLCFPKPPRIWTEDYNAWADEYTQWQARASAFSLFLDVGAWENAAMMLVPEGWFWRVGHSTLYAGWAHLNRKHPDFCNREDEHSAQAATPALALTAASLRARSENPA
ncbi:hypothetical protein BSL82_15815 [Tardibacter chloracetimidivorans]|uniref:Uncharacterized protein n=1 Tax=Tardibacter chloracetimidivorans TaxID=1921510 RepID=A0A1L3ZY70_9SPHN|nr:hypothetical protein [Tardibacter chloracetimidivorans]API60572.1 hypothetical protein BSL82_15815 [Tardibacter chloracetimidivorans]